jgi:DNA-3-methyladenine glycosylase II
MATRTNGHVDAAALAALDPVLARLVAQYGPPRRRRPLPGSQRFGALCRMIVYQQLAGNAAAAIHRRFVDALGGTVTPERVLAASPVILAASGLSANKAAAITDLAVHVADGRVALERIGRLSDDDLEAHLVAVRGIGPWTAQLFMLSVLGRPDVWPVGDLGVRVGFARAWELDEVPTPKELLRMGEPFRPFRSAVAGYCWQVANDRGPQ